MWGNCCLVIDFLALFLSVIPLEIIKVSRFIFKKWHTENVIKNGYSWFVYCIFASLANFIPSGIDI